MAIFHSYIRFTETLDDIYDIYDIYKVGTLDS